MHEYEIRVGNSPDADGHYGAEIALDGDFVKQFYHHDRTEVVEAAKRWVEAHRAYDPEDVETIKL